MIWYELLEPSTTADEARYQRQLDSIAQNLPESKEINAKLYFSMKMHNTSNKRGLMKLHHCEPLIHVTYSPDLPPSDSHLFASMSHIFSNRFNSYVKKLVVDFAQHP